jgi:L-lactate dehydrogenase complex protein LldG
MSKENILAAIRRNKPPLQPLPEVPDFQDDKEPMVHFIRMVETGGGKVLSFEKLGEWLSGNFPGDIKITSAIPGFPGNVSLGLIQNPRQLEDIEVAIVPSSLGVAENGAVWLSEEDSRFRVLPFIAQHLVVVLDRKAIVSDMHEAYRWMGNVMPGFGVFVAGPSKTADIEQALVVGAQGARSFTVALT